MNMYDLQLADRFRYAPADTYRALLAAVSSLKGFDVERAEDSVMTVYLRKCVSTFSRGEKFRITVSPGYEGTSEVTIISTPVKRSQLHDPTGSLKIHMDSVFIALAEELKKLGPAEENGKAEIKVDVYDQIKKLADLKQSGIVTEEEFVTKKRQLLGL